MATRPVGYEVNRHPSWEIVDILDSKLGGNLIPNAYDYIGITYTGTDATTIVYKTGGALGTTVGTLTLAYSAPGVLTSVTKT